MSHMLGIFYNRPQLIEGWCFIALTIIYHSHLRALALRISSFCAKGTRSNSSSTPKSPRATIRAWDLAMMPSMLLRACDPQMATMVHFWAWGSWLLQFLGSILFETHGPSERNRHFKLHDMSAEKKISCRIGPIQNHSAPIDPPVKIVIWNINPWISIYIWLVVYLPLWKIWIRQLGWWNSQDMGK